MEQKAFLEFLLILLYKYRLHPEAAGSFRFCQPLRAVSCLVLAAPRFWVLDRQTCCKNHSKTPGLVIPPWIGNNNSFIPIKGSIIIKALMAYPLSTITNTTAIHAGNQRKVRVVVKGQHNTRDEKSLRRIHWIFQITRFSTATSFRKLVKKQWR